MPQVTDPGLLSQLNGGQATAPAAPGIIRGRPKQPAPVRDEVRQGNVLSNQKVQGDIALQGSKIREAKAKADIAEEKRDKLLGEKSAAELQGVHAELQNVIDTAKKAKQLSKDGLFATGFGAETAGSVGGTAARDVQSLLNTIGSNTAFTRLQKMRDESPTGGALGQVSEIELALLRDSIASLDPTQSDAQFQDNMDTIIKHYESVLNKTGGLAEEKPASFDDETMAVYNQFIRDNPDITPEELRGFARGKFGVNVENAEEVLAHFRSTGQLATKADVEPSLTDSFLGGAGDIVEGLGDVLGLVGNPANAAINAVAGTELSTDLGQTFRDASGLPDNPNKVASAINKGGVSALTFAGAARPAANIATGAAQNAFSRFAASPGVDTIGGAAAGGAASLAPTDNPGAQVAAGLFGGLTASGLAQSSRNIAQRFAGQPNALANAAQRQSVDLLPADAGGPIARRTSAAAVQSPLSATPILNRAAQSQSQIGRAAQRQADNQGAVLAEDEAGEAIRKSGDLFIKKTSERGSRLYDRANEAAKGVTIKPLQAVQTIDAEIAKLSELGQTNAPLIQALNKLKGDISDGVSVSGLRDARTQLSGRTFDGKLRSNNEQRIFGDVLNSLSDDIDAGLRQAGRGDAANMFKRADDFWKQRVEQIDQVLQPVMGKNKSGEQILQAVETMAKGKGGGAGRLARLMRELPPEQLGDVRATLISRLGKASAGQQDDAGQTFSASTFLTNWNKMSAKGKNILFSDGDLRRNLNDIAKLANATKEAQKFANHSNTAGGIAGNTLILGGVAYVNPAAALVGGGSQFLTGQVLASPRFANWLAKAPAKPSKQYYDRLSAIAAKEPVIANDLKSIQNFLQGAPVSPGNLAASEKIDGGGEEPPQ